MKVDVQFPVTLPGQKKLPIKYFIIFQYLIISYFWNLFQVKYYLFFVILYMQDYFKPYFLLIWWG